MIASVGNEAAVVEFGDFVVASVILFLFGVGIGLCAAWAWRTSDGKSRENKQ